ncbi:MAG: hypothetical protein KAR06_05000 [Deltaproteobacteria bacterium]|nr:hypothetical protein [Deltaproteobacteria bacterium]
MNEDTNSIIREFLVNQATLTAIVGTRIYCPRLPENATLPALGFFTRGGTSTPYIPGIPEPSVQFDCWGSTPQAAREVYRALYNVLQGIQRQVVTVGGTDYIIWSAIEEVQGQDLPDDTIPNYFRTLCFFKFMIRAE